MNPLKRLGTCLAIVITLLAGLMAISVPAIAASEPTCKGSACDGLDPAKTNCTEGATVIQSNRARTESGDYGHLELRYSKKCHSNWARFTPWHGVQAWLADGAAGAEAAGSPWIWRQGVANSLRRTIGRTGGIVSSSWTAMVTADGVTCTSLEAYETEYSQFGGSERRSLGTYNAPCMR